MAISKNVTIQQIAKQAQVSTATASRVINQPGSVKSETRAKVLQAMKDLNYQVKQNSTRMILATYTDFSNPFYRTVNQGMMDAAENRGYQLLLHCIKAPSSKASYDFLLNSPMFQGIILTHTVPDPEVMDSLRAKYAVVMCSQYNDADDVPCVIIDDYTAAKKAVNYLISIGKQRIAMINASVENSYAFHRERGYNDALSAAGLSPAENRVIHIPTIDFDAASVAAYNLLSSPTPPDAVFCVSDVLASAVIRSANQLGLSVPEDVAVMGFDNVDLCSMTTPTISTVSQPMYLLGWQSCNLLLDQIENAPILTNKILLNTDIIVRGST